MAASGGASASAPPASIDLPSSEDVDAGRVEWTRDLVLAIAGKRDQMEEEMDTLMASLGEVGLSEPLVDKEGFPRADVDVAAVRAARHRHAMLRTDYSNATKMMEKGLLALHAASAADGSASSGAGAGAPSRSAAAGDETGEPAVPTHKEALPKSSAADSRAPFATVGQVQPGGPGARAGLRIGDSVLAFGEIDADGLLATLGTDPSGPAASGGSEGRAGAFPLGNIAALVQRSGGQTLPVVVRRRGGPGAAIDTVMLELPVPPRLA